jgi:hypothetical protein
LLDLVLAADLLLMRTVGILGKPLLSVVIVLASVRYGLNGVYELTASGGVQTASGVIGCAILLAPLNGGLASSLEDVKHRIVLPFGRHGKAREAIVGNLADQVGPVAKEAGVPQAAIRSAALPSVFLTIAASEARDAVASAEI